MEGKNTHAYVGKMYGSREYVQQEIADLVDRRRWITKGWQPVINFSWKSFFYQSLSQVVAAGFPGNFLDSYAFFLAY